jgi:hypothetical protein
MGDVHFILRHALTGAILLIFIVVGSYAVDPVVTRALVVGGLDREGVALALAAVPILGITIQGAHILVLNRLGRLFTDPARRFVSARLKAIARKYSERSNDDSGIWASILRAPDDAIFVWPYHSFANHDLIEWARTRRSYYYLGINWVAAALVGFAGGAAAVWVGQESDWRAFALFVCLFWIYGAARAAGLMKRDADTMEALWAVARADPEFRAELWNLLGLTPGSTDPA